MIGPHRFSDDRNLLNLPENRFDWRRREPRQSSKRIHDGEAVRNSLTCCYPADFVTSVENHLLLGGFPCKQRGQVPEVESDKGRRLRGAAPHTSRARGASVPQTSSAPRRSREYRSEPRCGSRRSVRPGDLSELVAVAVRVVMVHAGRLNFTGVRSSSPLRANRSCVK